MATKIVTKNSSTASAVPTASDLVQGELAVNVADKRLFTEDNGGSIVELGTNPSTIDINAGSIDGTAIGASSASTGAFTTLTATGLTVDTNTLYVDSTNNRVGIGTSSPDANLVVYETATSGTDHFAQRWRTQSGGVLSIACSDLSLANPTWQIRSGSSEPIAFNQASNERMRIGASGNVSIGTSATSAPLRVNVGTDQNCAINTSGGNPRITAFNDAVTASVPLGFNGSILKFETGGSERARIDSSGDLLVNTTSSGVWSNATQSVSDNGHSLRNDGIQGSAAYKTTANVGYVQYLNRTGSDGGITAFRKDGSTVGSIGAYSGTLAINSVNTGIMLDDTNNVLRPTNASGGSRDAIISLGTSSQRFKNLYLSGDVYLNNTNKASIPSTAMSLIFNTSNTSYPNILSGGYGGSHQHARFYMTGSLVGSIVTTASATAYNTSSDYRLKENVVAMTGATERLKQLNPSRFNFIADADTTVDGFLAHEVADVVPEAISGEKDAMMDEEYEVTPEVLDDEGNVVTEAVMGTRSVPDYQGIDQSKLVPLLVATIQELEARITQLENN